MFGPKREAQSTAKASTAPRGCGKRLRSRSAYQRMWSTSQATVSAPMVTVHIRCTLMLVVLGRAALVSSQVLYVEAHGTGTALGDPTEVGSLSLVHRSVERDSALVVGAVMANMGHSETPSGLAGLIKVNAQLLGATKTGNAHLRLLNPLLAQQVAGFAFPTQTSSEATSAIRCNGKMGSWPEDTHVA